jgi:hypothetical protein
MSDELLVSRRDGLVEAEVDGEIVALHVDNGTCYGFNQTATAIWKLLEQPRRTSEICDALAGEFDVDREQCERDVLALLRDLEGDGLIDLKPAAAAD